MSNTDRKSLSEMTLEELWELFPIFLTAHDPHWAAVYAEEAAALKKLLPYAELHHIGSTAIDGIWAKPIIDILAVVRTADKMRAAAKTLEENGYIAHAVGDERISLNKGYTENGFAEKVFHLHLRLEGDADEIFFRDYLNAHPDIAAQYEKLKLGLWKKFEHDRDGYTAAKTEFVKKYTLAAKAERTAN